MNLALRLCRVCNHSTRHLIFCIKRLNHNFFMNVFIMFGVQYKYMVGNKDVTLDKFDEQSPLSAILEASWQDSILPLVEMCL